ncbi:MAG: fimbria/pilus periplasmic chaperone [Cetobacterium sp.]
MSPTKVEINLLKDCVEEISLKNDTQDELKLLSYFETPPEYEDAKLQDFIQVFPKLISIPPNEQKTVKIVYKLSEAINHNKKYKSYIIFKELPTNKVDKNKVTIYNEIGIGIIGKIK